MSALSVLVVYLMGWCIGLVDETKVKQIIEYCESKPPFLVDKGPWYREAFERLGLEYRRETQGGGSAH
jgi:hypothetical protein